MVAYFGSMAQVVARPDHHIVANANGRLDSLVFQDEAVVADGQVWPGGGLAAHIGGQCVAGGLGLLVLFLTQAVQLGVR